MYSILESKGNICTITNCNEDYTNDIGSPQILRQTKPRLSSLKSATDKWRDWMHRNDVRAPKTGGE